MTECSARIDFERVSGRRVEGAFDGGLVSSDGGLLLMREMLSRNGLLKRFSLCFTDHRDQSQVMHSVEDLVTQRLMGLVAGYEDLNDHDSLRNDPVLQLLNGRVPGEDEPLAGKSTLNRLELTPSSLSSEERYKKIVCGDEKLKLFLITEFIRYAKREKLKEIILDADATDIPIHGNQEDRFYHGYYGHHCYLPLYIFCGEFPLWAELRPSNIDASLGTENALSVIVPLLQEALPKAKIIFRADSGFAREGIMKWCEDHGVDYIIGVPKNPRLLDELAPQMEKAKAKFEETKEPSRVFATFSYQTLDSWSKARKIVGKAEHLEKGANPRFVVTTLNGGSQDLYEKLYCMRGDAENRVKEQLQLFADRTSCKVKRGNQIRLWFSAVASLIMALFKHYVLKGTMLETVTPNTVRLKLIKLAVKVTVSVRRVYLSFASSFPLQNLFVQLLHATGKV